MGIIRLNMSPKEINEGYRAGIPEQIMAKMIQGMELIEKEKDFVKSRGKVYVLGHTKYRGQTRIKPQLRDLPGGVKITPEEKWREKQRGMEELERIFENRGYDVYEIHYEWGASDGLIYTEPLQMGRKRFIVKSLKPLEIELL